MPLTRPATLIAELSYQCPLHCPYCSNPVDIGGETYRHELETEHWVRAFGEARALGVLQLALTGGEPMLRRDLVELCAGARLRYDEVREEHLLLIPEGAVKLNATAADVLELCDGERSLDDIAATLSERYGGADVRADVEELVDAMAQRGLVVDAAA